MRSNLSLVFALFIVFLFGCKKGTQGIAGFNSLVQIDSIKAGIKCTNGGLSIKTGVDKNANNALDINEVTAEHYVCNGSKGNDGINGSLDNQIFIRASNGVFFKMTTQPEVIYAGIPEFNISNYPGVDSVVLLANPYATTSGGQARLELYNMTDNVAIANSEITATEGDYYNYFHASTNIFSSLPKKKVTLGLRLTTSNPAHQAASGNAMLLLYRK